MHIFTSLVLTHRCPLWNPRCVSITVTGVPHLFILKDGSTCQAAYIILNKKHYNISIKYTQCKNIRQLHNDRNNKTTISRREAPERPEPTSKCGTKQNVFSPAGKLITGTVQVPIQQRGNFHDCGATTKKALRSLQDVLTWSACPVI